jgi:hypothetical protein
MAPRPICARHRWAHEGLSVRTMATPLGRSRQTPRTSLAAPSLPRPRLPRPRHRTPCLDAMARLLESAPQGSAALLRPRLQAQDGAGGSPLVRDSWPSRRGATQKPQPVIRCASAPGVPGQSARGPGGSMASGGPPCTTGVPA